MKLENCPGFKIAKKCILADLDKQLRRSVRNIFNFSCRSKQSLDFYSFKALHSFDQTLIYRNQSVHSNLQCLSEFLFHACPFTLFHCSSFPSFPFPSSFHLSSTRSKQFSPYEKCELKHCCQPSDNLLSAFFSSAFLCLNCFSSKPFQTKTYILLQAKFLTCLGSVLQLILSYISKNHVSSHPNTCFQHKLNTAAVCV